MTIVIIWAVCAIASGVIGAAKGRVATGWILGILLGVIGLFIILILPTKTEKSA